MLTIPVFGTKFRIGWPFLGLLLIYSLLGMTREALIALLSVACHETAHALVAAAHDVRVESVELVPFGGVAQVSGLMEFDPRVETSVALAGPAGSFLLAALGAALFRAGVAPRDVGLIIDFNLLLGALNLLPALPLDGGRVARAVLAGRRGFGEATRGTATLGKALAALMALLVLFLARTGQFWPNLLVMSGFIWAFAAAEQARAEFAFFRFLLSRKNRVGKSGMLLQEHFTAVSSLTLGRVARSFSPRRYAVVTVLDACLRPIGTVDETKIIAAILNGHALATLEDLVKERVR